MPNPDVGREHGAPGTLEALGRRPRRAPDTRAACLVQVTSSPGWGGRETLPLAIHTWRLKRDLESHFIVTEGTPLARYTADVAAVTVVPRGRFRLAAALRRFLKKRQRRRPSGTHRLALLSHFTRDLPAMRAALLGNRDVLLFVVKHVGPGPSKRDVLHRFVYHRIDRLLAVSEYIRAKCARVYPIQPERTSVWHPGVDISRFAFDAESRGRLRREAGREDHDLIVGYLGRITPNKGFEDLLDAAARLRAMFPALHLWIGGSSSEGERWYEDGLRSRVSSLGLSDTVRFCGWQDRGEEFLSAIDLFVVPSRREAFGLTTVEAMACARPVVGFRAAGTAEIVQDGETGLLADPSGETAANLTQEIQQLLRNPQRLQALGDRARRRAVDVFSHDAMMTRLHAEISPIL